MIIKWLTCVSFVLLRVLWYIFLPQTLASDDISHYALATAVLLLATIPLFDIQQYHLDIAFNFLLIGHMVSLEIPPSQNHILCAMPFVVVGVCKLINLPKRVSFEYLFFYSAFILAVAVAIDNYILPILFTSFFVVLIKKLKKRYLAIPFIALGVVWLLVVSWRIIVGYEQIWKVYHWGEWWDFYSGITYKIDSAEYLILVGFALFSMFVYAIIGFLEIRKLHRDEHVFFRIVVGLILLFSGLGQGRHGLYLALPITLYISSVMIYKSTKIKHVIIRMMPVFAYVVVVTFTKIISLQR